MSEDIAKKLKEAERAVLAAQSKLKAVHGVVEGLEEQLRNALSSAAQTFNVDVNQPDIEKFIQEFIAHPFFVLPRSEREWWLIVPRYITLEFGFLLAQEGPWNIFVVNQYADMMSQNIPQEFRREISLVRPFDGITVDGDLLKIARPDVDDVKEVKRRYSQFLGEVKDKKTVLVKKDRAFELMAALIRDGILPFTPHPVKKTDLRASVSKFTLRDYQQKDFQIFLECGAIGIFYPMGGGKSFVALEAISQLKGRKLIFVPNATVGENWEEYLSEFLTLPPDEMVDIVIYNNANVGKVKGKHYVVTIYDEVTTLPANTHLQFANVDTDNRICMTATPMREDSREDLIFALSGKALGVDWKYFIENNLVHTPEMTVWVETDLNAKFARCDELLKAEKKTIVFCDSKSLGASLSKRYKVPFVSGDTKQGDRLRILRENKWVIVSRIGDLGISLKDLDTIIEFDFMYGSRNQETQRVGRLFHSKERGSYHALTTVAEYLKYRKRFLEVYSKGVHIDWRMSAELPTDLSVYKQRVASKKVKITTEPSEQKKPKLDPEALVREVPLSERSVVDGTLLLHILVTEYAKKLGGLSTSHIRAIVEANSIKTKWAWSVSYEIDKLYKAGKIERRTVKNEKVYFLQS